MKNYFVDFSKNGEFVSSFSVSAKNLKKAKQSAQFHKRIGGFKGVRTFVRLNRSKK